MVRYLLILRMGMMGDIDVVMDLESKWFNEMHGKECEMLLQMYNI